MAKKKLKKAQAGTEMSAGQVKEARRDSIYNAAKAKTAAKYAEMIKEMPTVTAPKGKDTVKVGSVRITAATAKKKMGGQTKKKK
jgi:hypothetical protein